jgi:hypothetical protein
MLEASELYHKNCFIAPNSLLGKQFSKQNVLRQSQINTDSLISQKDFLMLIVIELV